MSVGNEGSDGSFRDRDRAVSSFLLRAREEGRCLDRGCMCHVQRRSGRGICGKGGGEGGPRTADMVWWYQEDGGGEADDALGLSDSHDGYEPSREWAASCSRCLSVGVRVASQSFLGAVPSAAAGRAPNSFSSACRGHVPELLFPFRKCSRPDVARRPRANCQPSQMLISRSNNSTEPTISDHHPCLLIVDRVYRSLVPSGTRKLENQRSH